MKNCQSLIVPGAAEGALWRRRERESSMDPRTGSTPGAPLSLRAPLWEGSRGTAVGAVWGGAGRDHGGEVL